jgi:hypothetical protein
MTENPHFVFSFNRKKKEFRKCVFWHTIQN